jgi:hypothetical protein
MKKIAFSDLTDSAQKRAEAMDDDRPVYARHNGRGYELRQIHFVDPNSAQYEKDEASLLKDGFKPVDFGR